MIYDYVFSMPVTGGKHMKLTLIFICRTPTVHGAFAAVSDKLFSTWVVVF